MNDYAVTRPGEIAQPSASRTTRKEYRRRGAGAPGWQSQAEDIAHQKERPQCSPGSGALEAALGVVLSLPDRRHTLQTVIDFAAGFYALIPAAPAVPAAAAKQQDDKYDDEKRGGIHVITPSPFIPIRFLPLKVHGRRRPAGGRQVGTLEAFPRLGLQAIAAP